jgi:hypothetical protein
MERQWGEWGEEGDTCQNNDLRTNLCQHGPHYERCFDKKKFYYAPMKKEGPILILSQTLKFCGLQVLGCC